MHILAADIGGTNTRLCFASIVDKQRSILAEKNYSSVEFDSFLSVLTAFLSEYKIASVDAACIAVAGPVKSGQASITNLPWLITEDQLSERLVTPRVKLINDFVAVAYGVPGLDDSDFLTLQQAVDVSKQGKQDAAVVGAGTGLGAAHLVREEGAYHVYSSETGHSGFAPLNEQQTRLLAWLQQQYAHVSLETVLSGSGLYRIYQFLYEVSGIEQSAAVKQAIQETDPAQVITEHALAEDDELCMKALDCFIDIYGSAAGDIALHYYPIAELYIAGGIAPKIKDKIFGQRFINALVNKGPMTDNLQQLTIKLILQEKVGLYGALTCGLHV